MPVVPVFVSSTFRDFHAERDAIRSTVVPALDAALAPYGARIEMLDLRWGVDTTEVADETLAHQQVLDVCLGEVDRCRPLFLGLIGDRFGWIPPSGRLVEAAGRAGITAEDLPSVRGRGLSVTALEVWHGIIHGQSDSVVALRSLTGQIPDHWRDTDPEPTLWLRSEVERASRARPSAVTLIEYEAAIEGGRIREADLEQFTGRLIDAMLPLAVRRAQSLLAAPLTPYESAASLLAESRRDVLVGRATLLEELDDLLRTPGSAGVVLKGDSGVGKTSVLIGECDRLRLRGTSVAQVLVGAGPGASGTDEVIRLLAAQLGIAVPQALGSAGETQTTGSIERPSPNDLRLGGAELRSWWRGELARLDSDTVIAIDGLDRLNPGGDRDDLPVVLAGQGMDQVHYLVTTTLASHVEALQHRGLADVKVGRLSPADASQAAREWALVDGRRSLPAGVAEILATSPRTPLWLTLAVSELGWLQQEDYKRAESSPVADAASAITDMLVGVASELPSTDVGLAARLLERAARLFPEREQARRFLGSLALTRSGLAPGDLESITGANPLVLSRARWLLGRQLVQRDETGRLAFDHSVVTHAALQHVGAEHVEDMHALIASNLGRSTAQVSATSGDPVAMEDLAWHAAMAGRSDLLMDALVQCGAPGMPDEDALSSVLTDAVRASRPNPDTVLKSVGGLPSAATPGCLPKVLPVLAEVLTVHGSGDLRLHECRPFIDAAVELIGPAHPQFPFPGAVNVSVVPALTAAGQVLADGIRTRPAALELLHRAQEVNQELRSAQGPSRARSVLTIRLNLAIAGCGAQESRAADFRATFSDVQREMVEESGLVAPPGPARRPEGPPGPIELALEAERLSRELLVTDPDDAEAAEWLIRSLLTYTEVAFEAILPKAQEAQSRARGLVHAKPNSPQYRALLVETVLALTRIQKAARSDLSAVRPALREAYGLAHGLVSEFPTSDHYAHLLSLCLGRVDAEALAGTVTVENFISAGPFFERMKSRCDQDPQRRSLAQHLIAAGYRYAQELEESGRPWRAASVNAANGRNLQRLTPVRIPIEFWVLPAKRLLGRALHWPSLFALGNGLLTLGVVSFDSPGGTCVQGRGPYSRWIYRDRKTKQVKADDEGIAVLWSGTAPIRSIRLHLASRVLLQLAGTAAVLGIAIPALVSRVQQGHWAIAAALGLGLAWQQFSRGASEWWDRAGLPGRPSTSAEVEAMRLLASSPAATPEKPDAARVTDPGNALQGRTMWRCTNDSYQVTGLAVARDEPRLYTARARGQIEVLDGRDGSPVQRFHGADQTIRAIALSNEGSRLVSANADGTLSVWDPYSGELAKTLQGHTDRVVGASVSPDGQYVGSASADRTVRIWHIDSGATRAVLTGHRDVVHDCAFHPDGTRIASASWDGTTTIWDLGSGQPTFSLRAPRALGYPTRAFNCTFSPDGRLLVGRGSGGRVRIWDAESGATLHTIRGGNDAWGLAVSPDSLYMAGPGRDNGLGIWDLRTGRQVARAPLPEALSALAWDPVRPLLFCGSGTNTTAIEFADFRLGPVAVTGTRNGSRVRFLCPYCGIHSEEPAPEPETATSPRRCGSPGCEGELILNPFFL